MNKRIHLVAKGIVQGVYYRYNTMRMAGEYHVTGWVRNRSDGSVEILCEGTEENLNRMILWCEKGPAGARVNEIEKQWEEYTGEFKTFEIR
ncbi:MAG TPA: acylphosphatase [Syntrophorhabdaceae bacterium]|nr:acylphosphatase [Syntrophorhabdaceae bacterium]